MNPLESAYDRATIQRGRSLNILLVEDEERIASFMSKGLTAEGHHVQLASTASEGASLAVTYEFDVILLDLMLPDASGKDALERIRQVSQACQS
jgi:DNA-binding response OmpR family regulator